jgi:hypothetical protein
VSNIEYTRWTRTLQYDRDSDEYFIDLDGIAEHMGWNVETELEWVVEDNKVILRKKEEEV